MPVSLVGHLTTYCAETCSHLLEALQLPWQIYPKVKCLKQLAPDQNMKQSVREPLTFLTSTKTSITAYHQPTCQRTENYIMNKSWKSGKIHRADIKDLRNGSKKYISGKDNSRNPTPHRDKEECTRMEPVLPEITLVSHAYKIVSPQLVTEIAMALLYEMM